MPTYGRCDVCSRVYRVKLLEKCANCPCIFCESCCEIPMEFEIIVKVDGKDTVEKGYYCTEACMRQHNPGLTLVNPEDAVYFKKE
jgi:hypothetical protein